MEKDIVSIHHKQDVFHQKCLAPYSEFPGVTMWSVRKYQDSKSWSSCQTFWEPLPKDSKLTDWHQRHSNRRSLNQCNLPGEEPVTSHDRENLWSNVPTETGGTKVSGYKWFRFNSTLTLYTVLLVLCGTLEMGSVALPGESVGLRDAVCNGRCTRVDIPLHDPDRTDAAPEDYWSVRIRA